MANIQSNPLTVLVADDDRDLLFLVKMELEREGFRVEIAHNGEGISTVALNKPIDLILLDISMDGVNGDDICRELKAHKILSAIPIILFSANEDLEQIACECGADGFIAKPFESATVRKTILEKVRPS